MSLLCNERPRNKTQTVGVKHSFLLRHHLQQGYKSPHAQNSWHGQHRVKIPVCSGSDSWAENWEFTELQTTDCCISL